MGGEGGAVKGHHPKEKCNNLQQFSGWFLQINALDNVSFSNSSKTTIHPPPASFTDKLSIALLGEPSFFKLWLPLGDLYVAMCPPSEMKHFFLANKLRCSWRKTRNVLFLPDPPPPLLKCTFYYFSGNKKYPLFSILHLSLTNGVPPLDVR